MFNEQNVRPVRNGRMRYDDDSPASASATRIEYRDLNQVLEVEVAGKSFVIRAGSLFLYNILKNSISKHRSEVLKKAEHIEELLAKLRLLTQTTDKKKNPQADEPAGADDNETTTPAETGDILQTERTREILEVYQELFGERWEVVDATEKEMLRCVQLILLDGKNPNWVDQYDTFPPEADLEAVISTKELQRKASILELNNALFVYRQMNDPEAVKKDFFKIAGMAMM